MMGSTPVTATKDEDLIWIRSEVGFGALSAIPVGFVAKILQTKNLNPVDPAGPYCYRGGTKTCESSVSSYVETRQTAQ